MNTKRLWHRNERSEKEMKKANLRTGMVAETRNGNIYLVMLEPDCEGKELINFGSGFMPLSRYADNLMIKTGDEEFDIMKVYSVGESICWLLSNKKLMEYKLIWEREECKEMTVEEVEKALGYKIKIVGDRDE